MEHRDTTNPMRVVQVAAPVREQLVTNLRHAISDWKFQPGERLVERELIEMSGASRTSVREALRQLEAEGLVTTVPHKGTFVAIPTQSEAKELFEIRAPLEAIAAQRFTENALDEEVEELRNVLDGMSVESDVKALLAIKDQFYRILGKHSPMIYAMLSTLHLRVRTVRRTSLSLRNRVETSLKELDGLVAAIERRDAAAAAEAAALHVRMASHAFFRAFNNKG